MQYREAAEDFLRFCAVERQLSQHTLSAYAGDLADFRSWLRADVAIADVTILTLKDYLGEMVSTRKLATATVRRRFACLRAFFKRATERTLRQRILFRPGGLQASASQATSARSLAG